MLSRDEFRFIAALDQAEVLLEGLEVVFQQSQALGCGEDDLGVEFGVLVEEPRPTCRMPDKLSPQCGQARSPLRAAALERM